MKQKEQPNICPKCGTTIPEDAPQGLCPQCVLGDVAEATQPSTSAPFAVPPSIEEIASAFPLLELVELIGSGGMGTVFKARQPKLDRYVALKILNTKLSENPAFAERFSREARLLARLNHPGIVTVYDFGEAEGYYYLLMEYVDGVNLRQAMAAGRFSPQEALSVVPRICEALQFAHEAGVLHRDIKPENILLDDRGRIKIADFGIAKLVGDTSGNVTLTSQNAAVGTPHYMAPEQLEHPRDVDQRADIYSLGVVFYEMLTGQLPMGRFDLPSQKSNVDPRVDPIVLRTLERDREKRYGSATEVQTQVEGLRSTPPPIPGAAPAPSFESSESGQPARPSSGDGTRVPGKAIGATVMTVVGLLLSLPWLLIVGTGMITLVSHHGNFGVGLLGLGILGLSALVWGSLVIGGMFLGMSAVQDIRRNPPPQAGMGLAVFAVSAAPVLLLNLVLGGLFVAVPLVLLPVVFKILALPLVAGLIVLDWLIVRRIWRWAKGSPVPGHSGGRRGGAVWAVVVLLVAFIFLLPALVILLAMGFWTVKPVRSDNRPAMVETVQAVGGIRPDPQEWVNGRPDLDLGFSVAPGLVTTFTMVRSNQSGMHPIEPLRGFVATPDGTSFEGRLFWGKHKGDPRSEPGSGIWGLKLVERTGSTSGAGMGFPYDWESLGSRTSRLDLSSGRSSSQVVARRLVEPADAASEPEVELLCLEVETFALPQSVRSFVNAPTMSCGVAWEDYHWHR